MSTAKTTGFGVGALMLIAGLYSTPTVAAESPQELLKTVSDTLLTTIRMRRAEFRRDDQALFDFVRSTLSPVVDYERVVELILGKKLYQEARPKCRDEFAHLLETQLIRLYSQTILTYSDGTITYLPFESKPGKPYQVVRTEFTRSSEEPTDIMYLMREVDGSWRVFEIRAAGIFLIKSLKKSLRPEIEQKGLEAVIERLRNPDKVSAYHSHWPYA